MANTSIPTTTNYNYFLFFFPVFYFISFNIKRYLCYIFYILLSNAYVHNTYGGLTVFYFVFELNRKYCELWD